jgi:thioredoxin-like negative regulator of GroEL
LLLTAAASVTNTTMEIDKNLNTFNLNSDNIKEVLVEFLENPDNVKPLLVNLIMGECTVGGCVKFSKDLHLLAKIVKNQNRVAHVACNYEPLVCQKFPQKFKRNSIATVYVTKDGVYAFSGEQTKEALLEYLSSDNHKKDEHLEPDM